MIMITSKLSLSDWIAIGNVVGGVFIGGYRIGSAEEAVNKVIDRMDRVEQRVSQSDSINVTQDTKLEYLQKQQEKTTEVTEKMNETLNNLNGRSINCRLLLKVRNKKREPLAPFIFMRSLRHCEDPALRSAFHNAPVPRTQKELPYVLPV